MIMRVNESVQKQPKYKLQQFSELSAISKFSLRCKNKVNYLDLEWVADALRSHGYLDITIFVCTIEHIGPTALIASEALLWILIPCAQLSNPVRDC